MKDLDDEFYNEIERLARENNLPPTQRICPNCRDLLDCKDRVILVECSCGSLAIDCCGMNQVDRIIYKAPVGK